jgi:hypothetical protein
MKKSTLTIVSLSLLIIALTSSTEATRSNNGITGRTTSGCGGGCHPTQSGTVTLTNLPTSVLKGTAYSFNLIYTPTASYKYFGLDIKVSAGTLTAGTGMKKSGTEITHSAVLGGTTTSSYTYPAITWTSPTTTGAVTFNFACVGNNSSTTTAGSTWQLGSFGTSVVLPVELTSFSVAKVGGNKVAISWQTAVEINSDHFEIEKSLDGKTFVTISKVAATGNSSVSKSYSTVDVLSNTSAVTYYRLKTVDKNGEFGYSSIQPINTKINTILNSVYPNPAKKGQDINVELTSEKEQSISFVLINGQGKIMSSKEKIVTKGYSRIGLKFGNYIVAGNYYLQVKEGNNLLPPVSITIVE